MIRNFKITVYYEVKGLDYEFRGNVCDTCLKQEDVITAVNINVCRLKEAYKGYEVKVDSVHFDDAY